MSVNPQRTFSQGCSGRDPNQKVFRKARDYNLIADWADTPSHTPFLSFSSLLTAYSKSLEGGREGDGRKDGRRKSTSGQLRIAPQKHLRRSDRQRGRKLGRQRKEVRPRCILIKQQQPIRRRRPAPAPGGNSPSSSSSNGPSIQNPSVRRMDPRPRRDTINLPDLSKYL